jgi:hypothetical protein
MLKAADALAASGYDVRVVSTNHTPWAAVTDREVMATRGWAWTVIDYDRTTARATQVMTGARFRMAQAISSALGPARVPMSLATRAYSRMHDEIVRAATADAADFVYGGTTGALAAVAESAARLRVPYAVDFEDLHSGEYGPGAEVTNALAARVERHVIGDAAFLTAGSPMIADAYQAIYGVRPIPIHNTFSMARSKRPVSAATIRCACTGSARPSARDADSTRSCARSAGRTCRLNCICAPDRFRHIWTP